MSIKKDDKIVQKNEVTTTTRVALIKPFLIEGITKKQMDEKVTKLYKKYGFNTEDGRVLNHTQNILRDIKNGRKGWWCTYKWLCKDDMLKIVKLPPVVKTEAIKTEAIKTEVKK